MIINSQGKCSKLPANALFFTIIISLVIALLCSSLIFIAYFHKVQIQQNETKERLIRNANSAIQLLLSSNTKENKNFFDLYGEGNDSVLITKAQWGLFEVGHVKAISHRDSVSRTFLIGSTPDSIWNSALYLVDQGYSVTFAGNTLVKGIAYLPAAGPTSGAVDGKDFNKKKLVDGEIRKSKNALPDLNKEFIKRMLAQTDFKTLPSDLPLNALKTDSIVISFDKPTRRIHAKSPIFLSHIILKGNIIISSDTLIEVSSSVQLHNAILTAPRIVFKDNFKGSVQAFASDSLITGEASQFLYPSVLALIETDSIENEPKLILSKKSKLAGIALIYVSFIDRSKATIVVSPEAEVTGQVYADGFVNLGGKVSGSVFCNKFMLYRRSGIYENYLLDCTIDRSLLSKSYLGSPLFNNSKMKIAKWLE